MKFLFVLVLVAVNLINISKSQSVEEVASRCRISGDQLHCDDFPYIHLLYKEEFSDVASVWITGNFTELTIDPSFTNVRLLAIRSSNLQKFQVSDYTNLTAIQNIDVRYSEQIISIDFTGAENLSSTTGLTFIDNNVLAYPCENLQLSNLRHLSLTRNEMSEFDLSCLPPTIVQLALNENNFSTVRSFDSLRSLSSLVFLSLSGSSLGIDSFNFAYLPVSIQHLSFENNGVSQLEGCEALKNLTSLRRMYLRGKNLTDFDLACLPLSLEVLALDDNRISDFDNISKLPVPRSRPFRLGIQGNPIRCTCAFLRDYVQLLDSNNVIFSTNGDNQAVTCANVDSKLAAYPWSTNATAIKLHDASALGCLTGGEDDSEGFSSFNLFRRIVAHIFPFFSCFF